MLLSAVSVIHVNVQLLTAITSLFLPLIVGLITKQVASSAVKAVTLAVLATLNGLITSWIQLGGNVNVEVAVNQIINSFIVATGAHIGFWKATGTSDAVSSISPNFGLGSSTPPNENNASA